MRTDSPRISDDAMQMVRSYVSDVYSDKYLPEKPIIYKGKKDAQDAHEAIRPTFVGRTPDDLKAILSDDEYKLYKLIWTRFAASQMNPAIYDQTSAEITAGDYLFRASGRVLKFDGFLKVYEETADEDAETGGRRRRHYAAAADGRARCSQDSGDQSEAALHRAAAAIHRSVAGQDCLKRKASAVRPRTRRF